MEKYTKKFVTLKEIERFGPCYKHYLEFLVQVGGRPVRGGGYSPPSMIAEYLKISHCGNPECSVCNKRDKEYKRLYESLPSKSKLKPNDPIKVSLIRNLRNGRKIYIPWLRSAGLI